MSLVEMGRVGKGRFQGLVRPGRHPPGLGPERRRGNCRPGASLHRAAAPQAPEVGPGEDQSGIQLRSAPGNWDGRPSS